MLPRFQHLLVPLDFSIKNQVALDIAFDLAEVHSAQVTLLHVIERFDATVEDAETEAFYDRLRQRADAELERRVQRFHDVGLQADYKLRLGSRATEIVRYATEHAVDLVILSSHPIDPDEPRKSIATLSYQVSILVPCPVLMMK